MSVQGFINRIRRQSGLPQGAPHIGTDEILLDPDTGSMYFSPTGGGTPLRAGYRALSGRMVGAWEEEALLEFNPDGLNTVPGPFVLGRTGVGDYYLQSTYVLLSSLIQSFDSNVWHAVTYDSFNVRLIYVEVGVQAPAGAPGGSLGIVVRRVDTGVKQDFNGAFNMTLFYK